MKKLIYYTLLFLSFQMYGQDSWNIILLEGTSCPECRHRKMIQTNDGGFIVIIGTADDGSAGFPKAQHWLRKYDGTGELLWDKRYDFGVTTPGPNGWGGGKCQQEPSRTR